MKELFTSSPTANSAGPSSSSREVTSRGWAPPLFHDPSATAKRIPAPHQPSLEVIEADGVVTRLVVTCSCGEKNVIECVY